MKVGMLLAGAEPFGNEVELDRKILQPKIIHDAEAAPAQLDLAPGPIVDVRDELGFPHADPIAERAAEVESLADAGLDPR